MSGTTRRTISISQAAARESAYNAPEGYHLVWQDEFNSGTELNADDWTHEVQNSGWVNNELQRVGEAVLEAANKLSNLVDQHWAPYYEAMWKEMIDAKNYFLLGLIKLLYQDLMII